MSPRSFVCDTSIVAGIVSSFVNVPQDSIWYTRIDPYHEAYLIKKSHFQTYHLAADWIRPVFKVQSF